MAFSDRIVREAWERAGGQCECNRRTHRHFYTPCGRVLKWQARGGEVEGGWEARYVNMLDGDKVSNCEIVCSECNGQIR